MRTWYLTNIEDSTDIKAYNDIRDLLSDIFYSDDPRVQDLIKDWINEIYSPIEVPGIGKVDMGDIVQNIYDSKGYGLDDWIEEYMTSIEDEIIDDSNDVLAKGDAFEYSILNYIITCG